MKMCWKLLVLACCGVLSGFSDSSSRVSVRADEQTVGGAVIYLKGHVEITVGKVRIRANQAELNTQTGSIDAWGGASAMKIGAAPPLSSKPPEPLSVVRMNVNKPEQVVLLVSTPISPWQK